MLFRALKKFRLPSLPSLLPPSSRAIVPNSILSNVKKNFLFPREFHNSQPLRETLFYLKTEDVDYSQSVSFKLPEQIQLIAKNTTEKISDNNITDMMISELQGSFFIFLVQALKANRILEVGTFTGLSAACFAEGLRRLGSKDDAKVVTIEYSKEYYEMAKNNINNAGYSDLVELISNADKGGYIKYYDTILERNLLSDDGIIIADNVKKLEAEGKLDLLPEEFRDRCIISMSRFNEHVKNDPRTTQVLLPVFDGLSFMRKNI
ncbi:5882_t:CDS:2 [Diversispora eburnea]|uniref:5882_t:CDS:1 n=1 Tax=Diversispora eburnea TaxID=1213867 RepID=A0A9N8WED6_9GLOM|nr:5882_t:CDS:2 [Diversispora eburnea]